jgi:hypothetical protein
MTEAVVAEVEHAGVGALLVMLARAAVVVDAEAAERAVVVGEVEAAAGAEAAAVAGAEVTEVTDTGTHGLKFPAMFEWQMAHHRTFNEEDWKTGWR